MSKVFDQIDACLAQSYKWRGWGEDDLKMILDLGVQIRILGTRYDKRLIELRKSEKKK